MEIVRRYVTYFAREALYRAAEQKRFLPQFPPCRGKWLVHCSGGMRRIPGLSAFAGLPVRFLPAWQWPLFRAWAFPRCAGVLVWKKHLGESAALARKYHLPLIRVEDGFLRSLAPGVSGADPLSLVFDHRGIYYDAEQPSDLENLLNGTGWETPELLHEAEKALRDIVTYSLSKYNHAPDVPDLSGGRPCGAVEASRASVPGTGVLRESVPGMDIPAVETESPGAAGRKKVLVIDQTSGDLSIQRGMADDSSFQTMLDAALRENPDADIYVKTHPDVLSGKKSGFLCGAAGQGHMPDRLMADGRGGGIAGRDCPGPDCGRNDKTAGRERVHVLTCEVSPLSLLRQVDEVYTVTSQMGFEALFLGKPVHCFGMPFYAGWGLTDDRKTCPRRRRKRTLEEVFAAAYIKYTRYVHPATGSLCGIQEIIALLREQKKRNEQNRGYHACIGFRRWKQLHARAFLYSTEGEVAFFPDEAGAVDAAREHGGDVVVWASKETEETAARCEEAGVPLVRMEDGFIRSKGLGSDFYRPGSLVLDTLGIYYDPGRPSRLENILSETVFPEERLREAAALRKFTVEQGVTKYNINGGSDLPEKLPPGRKVVLVPGQVEDDASVRLGGCGIYSNLELLKAVRSARPDAFILFKEHPDVAGGNRQGHIPAAEALRFADAVITKAGIHHVLKICDEVHTLTSLAGFEALLRGIPVWTYGGPFYAGWGLTYDRLSFPRRKKLPGLDWLVAGALLEYPAYYHWGRRLFVDALSFVRAMKL